LYKDNLITFESSLLEEIELAPFSLRGFYASLIFTV